MNRAIHTEGLVSRGGGLVAKSCLTVATPGTVASRSPLSLELSRQEYWSGLPFTSPVVSHAWVQA